MSHRIYTLTDKAIRECLDWDTAIYSGEIETVQEFDTYAEAVEACETGNYDPELFGVE